MKFNDFNIRSQILFIFLVLALVNILSFFFCLLVEITWIKWIILFLNIGVFIGAYFLFRQSHFKSIESIEKSIKNLTEKFTGSIENTIHKNEFHQISSSISTINTNLETTSEFVREIGRGNLDAKIQNNNFSSDESFTGALVSMQQKLLELSSDDKRRTWATSGFAQLSEILRNNNQTNDELYHTLVVFIVNYLHANQAGLFVLNDENEEDIFLELEMCYAYDRKKYLQKNIKPGEGLLGECFLEKDIIYLTDIPQGYINITSGLGKANPGAVILVPLITNEEVFGVLELASFNKYEEHEIDFLRKIGESIASTIATVKRNEKTDLLLRRSQEMTEELRNQEEELKQNSEEIQATQEEISRKYALLFRDFTEFNKKAKFDQLTSIRSTKKKNIEDYFNIIRNQISTYVEDKMIIQAMKDFKRFFHGFSDDISEEVIQSMADSGKKYYKNEFLPRLNANTDSPQEIDGYWTENPTTIALQYHYIANNPNPTGKKHLQNSPDDNSKYSKVHEYYHPVIKNYLEKFGYYDIFLIDNVTGHIVYSVFKEVDYATSLKTGIYKNTNFGKVFNEVSLSDEKEYIKLVDFEPYDPSYTAPASFIATSIYDGDEKIGVLVFQMPIDKINSIMTGDNNWLQDGLGKTGETYLVGDDYKMRSMSRFLIEDKDGYLNALQKIGYNQKSINKIERLKTSILLQEVRTDAVKNVFEGKTESKIVNDYRGIPVLSSYTRVNIPDVNWAILSDIDEEEVLEIVENMRNNL